MSAAIEVAYAPARYVLPLNWASREAFDLAVAGLNPDSSPGFPLCRTVGTIGHYLKWDGFSFDPTRCEDLWQAVCRRMADRSWDPYKVFIKPELYSKEKMSSRRWRLIFSISLVDQVVERMLFRYANEVEVSRHYRIPSKPGWAPHGGGEITLKQQLSPRFGDDWLAIDIRGWDWNAPEWVFEIELEQRIRQNVRPDPVWEELVRARHRYNYYDAEVVLSSGEWYRQTMPGLMKSGMYNTISTNSRCMVMMHFLTLRRAGVEDWFDLRRYPIATMGDDTLQTLPATLTDRYLEEKARLGLTLKEVTRRPTFAGRDLAKREPEYFERHMARLIYADPEHLAETLESYQRDYAFSDKLRVLHGLIEEFCPEEKTTATTLQYWSSTGYAPK